MNATTLRFGNRSLRWSNMHLTELASFVRVVERGTLQAAAEAEGVPRSTISRRVARLEDALGVSLLRRSSRALIPTDDGRALYARAAGPLRELSAASEALTEAAASPSGHLVVTAPNDFGTMPAMGRLLADYRAQFPDVTLEVRLENRVVDLLVEGVDVALRAHAAETPGAADAMVRSLGTIRSGLYASVGYLERHGPPRHPSELVQHDLVLHQAIRQREIRLWLDQDTVSLDTGSPAIVVNDFALAHDLVAQGAGIGLLPAFLASSDRRDAEIVPVLPRWCSTVGRLSLVWPATRHLAPRVRAFLGLATQTLTGDDARLEAPPPPAA